MLHVHDPCEVKARVNMVNSLQAAIVALHRIIDMSYLVLLSLNLNLVAANIPLD